MKYFVIIVYESFLYRIAAAYCKLPSIDSNLPVGIEITLLEVLSRTQCCRRSYTLNAFTTGLSRVHSLLSPQTLPVGQNYRFSFVCFYLSKAENELWTNEGLLKVTLQEDLQLFHNVEVFEIAQKILNPFLKSTLMTSFDHMQLL
ncbi:909_t:CDS:2 [Funneliformis caledonium]|uniref:909_t:CDS:1 n=1 Tax=Funneliformis caledonium TaxID=1117310 RepID=A0A9N9ACX2_9GLOM|nr:909_t:CDS:2 [Funneliformis caledonium]